MAGKPIKTVEKPMVRRYTSYRSYLQDFYLYKKTQGSHFSFRRFSELSGIKSPNFLQLVMQGKRNMSPDVGASVSKAMGLLGSERRYFIALVQKEFAKTEADVANAQREISSAAKRLALNKKQSTHSKLLSTWYHFVVFEMVNLPDFQPTGAWISKRLGNLITAVQAEESLKLLLKSKFLELNSNGVLERSHLHIDTGTEHSDVFDFARILKTHMQTLDVWLKVLPQLSAEERELGLLIIPINKSKIPEFKERIRKFQNEIIEWIKGEEKPTQLVHFGTYLVPITQNFDFASDAKRKQNVLKIREKK